MSLVIFYSCYVGNAMMSMGGTAIICIYLTLCKNVMLLPAMLYFSSFALIFRAGDFMLYEFLCLIFIGRVFIKAEGKRGLLIFLPIMYALTHLLSSSINFGTIIPIIYVITLLFACVTYRDDLFENCKIMYLLGVLISSILGFLKPFSPFLLELLSEDLTDGLGTEYIVRFSGLSYDPNFYSIGAIISVMLLLLSNNKRTIATIIFSVLLICLGAITYSKSYILSIVFVFLLYFLDRKAKVTGKVLLLFILFFIISVSLADEYLYVIQQRFGHSSNLNELTTGREELWKLHLNHIADTDTTLLIGHGIYSIQGDKAAHNTYIQLLYSFGLIGIIVDILYLIKCFKLINKNWLTTAHIGIIAIIFMLFLNLSAYTFPSMWVCLFMVFILISKRSKNYGNIYNA